MTRKKVLLKEICHKTSLISQFGGIIRTPMSIHEIYELKHETKKPRIIVGKKIIAVLGDVVVKAYCVKKDTSEVFLVEHCFSYRNYISGDYPFHHLKPDISVKSELQGIITESVKCNEIRITGIVYNKLVFSLEKEYDLELIHNNLSCSTEHSEELVKPVSHGVVSPIKEDFEIYSADEILDSISYDDNYSDEEIYTKIEEGVNQDLSIVLE